MLSLDSCTSRLIDFTIISTKNVPIGTESQQLTKADKRVKGVDKKHIALFIPIGSPSIKEAIDKAIEQYPGAIGLSDGVIKSNFWYIPPFYGQSSTIAEGTPLYTKNLESTLDKHKQQSSYKEQNSSIIFYHEVKKGETLDDIAKKYNIQTVDIIKWNQINSSTLKEGNRILIYL